MAIITRAVNRISFILGPLFFAACLASVQGRVDFNSEVRPILADNCFRCHGPDAKARKAKLRLDQQQGATRDLGGYRAISPGKPTESELMVRILSDDPDEVMPPPKTKKHLTAGQKEILRKWIAAGGDYQEHWAFVRLGKPEIPGIATLFLIGLERNHR